jgi:hypothetical protein
MVAPSKQRVQEASVRVTAAIGVILLTLGGCGPRPQPPSGAAEPMPETATLRCEPWPEGTRPPSGPGLVQSADASLPGTESGVGKPVSVVVGDACVVLPASIAVTGLYCGAAEPAGTPLPCQVGEECAIGSIMVTDVNQYRQDNGIATCATFENWSRTGSRAISLWARTR